MEIDEFFKGYETSRLLFEKVRSVVDELEPTELRVTKSQITLRRRVGFGWVWVPGRYLRGNVAPFVLSVRLNRRDSSPRWKEIVEPTPGWFMHHLEIRAPDEIDDEVRNWLREAWAEAA